MLNASPLINLPWQCGCEGQADPSSPWGAAKGEGCQKSRHLQLCLSFFLLATSIGFRRAAPWPLLHASLHGGCVDPEASELVLAKGWDGDDLWDFLPLRLPGRRRFHSLTLFCSDPISLSESALLIPAFPQPQTWQSCYSPSFDPASVESPYLAQGLAQGKCSLNVSYVYQPHVQRITSTELLTPE